jgi:Domain of unknown function (DUF4234)
MAETVSVEGEQYLRRSPWGAWGLALITLGIYGLVWYYKINDEARRYLKDDGINPTRSLLAVFPGFLLIVPPFIAIWNTAKSIDRMEEGVGMVQRIQPILGLIASFFYSLHVVYYQSELNKVWDGTLARADAAPLPAQSTVSAVVPPAVPPPPLPESSPTTPPAAPESPPATPPPAG